MQGKGRVLFGMLITVSAFILLNLFAVGVFGYFQIQERSMVLALVLSGVLLVIQVGLLAQFGVQIGKLFGVNPKYYNTIMWATIIAWGILSQLPRFLKTSKFLQKVEQQEQL